MFAVGLKGIDMNNGQQYFNIKATIIGDDNGRKINQTIDLIPCETNMWAPLGDDYTKIYDRYDIGQRLCPAPGQ